MGTILSVPSSSDAALIAGKRTSVNICPPVCCLSPSGRMANSPANDIGKLADVEFSFFSIYFFLSLSQLFEICVAAEYCIDDKPRTN